MKATPERKAMMTEAQGYQKDRNLDALIQACKGWRKAEKRWAAIYAGGIEGDLDRAQTIEQRKLNELRIAFDKWEHLSNHA